MIFLSSAEALLVSTADSAAEFLNLEETWNVLHTANGEEGLRAGSESIEDLVDVIRATEEEVEVAVRRREEMEAGPLLVMFNIEIADWSWYYKGVKNDSPNTSEELN